MPATGLTNQQAVRWWLYTFSGITMHNPPQFITFTGADDNTFCRHMLDLSEKYPVEFGILFSPKLTGTPRYPSAPWITKLLAEAGGRLTLSAHICGGYSRELLDKGTIPALLPLLTTGAFRRIQINTADPRALDNTEKIAAFGECLGVDVILQSRDGAAFPLQNKTQWLFDASGGRGLEPASWPSETTDRLVGYAGGLRPDNVAAAVATIGAQAKDYWIDMETGMRDAGDRFCIALCEQVCASVFGDGN